ncbi:MAG: hypothetical protein L3J82_05570 [Planctomycetes bacterium]|nr:hypothetical protein [Planctomycetota bacterium]
MPKELGVARRDELMGTFPGEDVERASMLVRFLEGLGQLVPPAAEGKDTEISSRQENTETGIAPVEAAALSTETLEEPLLMGIEPEELLVPEPATLGAELSPEPASLEAMTEPTSLDSVPDLTSPELDHLEEDEDFTDMPETLPASGSLPTIAPEPQEITPSGQRDTGLLEMDGAPPSVDASLKPEDLGIDPEEEEEETSIQAEDEEAEKITSKVEHNRRDDPDSSARDTVNFYNQTQRMPGTRAINRDELDERAAEGTTALGAMPHDEPELDDMAEEIGFDDEPLSEPPLVEAIPADIDLSDATPVSDLPAVAESESERKDTQKFFVADILSQPDNDASSSDTAIDTPTETAVRSSRQAVPEPLPLPDPEVVGDFAASDDMLEPVEASERIIPEMVMMTDQAAVQPDHKSSDSTIDEATAPEQESSLQISTDTNKVTVTPETIPSQSALTRIVRKPEPEAADDSSSDDTAPDYAEPEVETDKPEEELEGSDSTDAELIASDSRPTSSRVRRITDALTRRLRVEKDETEKLIEAAEKVAQKLRDTSAASRTDLEAVNIPKATIDVSSGDPSEEITARHAEVPSKHTSGRLGDLLQMPVAEAEGTKPETEPENEPDELRRLAAALDRRTEKIKESSRRKTANLAEEPEPEFDENAETFRHPRVEDVEIDASLAQEPEPVKPRKERVPTSAISSLLDRIEDKLGGGAADIEDLYEESKSSDNLETDRNRLSSDPYVDMDIDELVSASARMREVIDEELNPSNRVTAKVPDRPSPITDPDSLSSRTAKISGTPLAKNLDNLWNEVSSRQTGVLNKGRDSSVRRRDEIGIGWTQEALWLTLGVITVTAAAVSSVFVYIVFQMFS